MTTKTIQWEQDLPTFSRGRCVYEGHCVLKTEKSELRASPIFPPRSELNNSYHISFRDKKSNRIEMATYNTKTGETNYEVREEGVDGVEYKAKPEKLLGYKDVIYIPGLPKELRTGIENLFDALDEKVGSAKFN